MTPIKNESLVNDICSSYKSRLNNLYTDFAKREFVTKDAQKWASIVRETLGNLGAKKLNSMIEDEYSACYYIDKAADKANMILSKSSRTFHRNMMLEERGVTHSTYYAMH